MRILLIPKNEVSFYKIFSKSFYFPNIFNPMWRNYLRYRRPVYEYNYLSDLNQIKECEVFVLGKLNKSYLSEVREDSTNPTGHNCPAVKNVNINYVKKNIKSFNCVIFSNFTANDPELIELRTNFIKNKVLVCIFEHQDIDNIELINSDNIITNGLIINKDFNLYFKKDIPLGINRPWLFPIAPDPIRLKSFKINLKKMSEKNISVFFSGILDKETTFIQRNILLNKFKYFKNSKIRIIDLNLHYSKRIFSNKDLENQMSEAKFVLSPPGRSWTTTRHVNMACFNCIPIISEPDIQTVNLELIDGKNCIKYKNLRNLPVDEQIYEVEKLIQKTKIYMEKKNEELEIISKNWRDHVFNNHTVQKKSEYILQIITNYLNLNKNKL
jgi:hypothetical protein